MEHDRLDDVERDASEHNRSIAASSPQERLSGAALKRPQITDALARTFFEEWARVGYGALSLDAVARKAGVGKAALYRRWRSKADMASDLVGRITAALPAQIADEDRGSLEADLHALLLLGARMVRGPLVRRIMPDLYASLEREPELAAALRPGEAARGQKLAAVIDRAVGRGELSADIDRGLAADLLFGPLYWRVVVLGRRVSRSEIRALAAMTAAALRQARRAPASG